MDAEEAARKWQKARQALRDARHDLENVQKLRSKTKELNVRNPVRLNLNLNLNLKLCTLTRTLTSTLTQTLTRTLTVGACMEEAPRRAAPG